MLFTNAAFPAHDTEPTAVEPPTIGPDFPPAVYAASSFFNISASELWRDFQPAVKARCQKERDKPVAGSILVRVVCPIPFDGGADLAFQIGTAKYGGATREVL